MTIQCVPGEGWVGRLGGKKYKRKEEMLGVMDIFIILTVVNSFPDAYIYQNLSMQTANEKNIF